MHSIFSLHTAKWENVYLYNISPLCPQDVNLEQ